MQLERHSKTYLARVDFLERLHAEANSPAALARQRERDRHERLLALLACSSFTLYWVWFFLSIWTAAAPVE